MDGGCFNATAEDYNIFMGGYASEIIQPTRSDAPFITGHHKVNVVA